jgi:hypothetical protein
MMEKKTQGPDIMTSNKRLIVTIDGTITSSNAIRAVDIQRIRVAFYKIRRFVIIVKVNGPVIAINRDPGILLLMPPWQLPL